MSQVAFAAILAVHSLVHLLGFVIPWRLSVEGLP